mmetsp:Transcript_44270/g.140394  ORF Transcript_44270/g.140394 Transcript_44270/m.140394 type:complete len:418 (-) Transcript_44270:664-1917(-)
MIGVSPPGARRRENAHRSRPSGRRRGGQDGAPEIVVGDVPLDELQRGGSPPVLELSEQRLEDVVPEGGRHEGAQLRQLGEVDGGVGRAKDLAADGLELLDRGEHEEHLGDVGAVLRAGEGEDRGEERVQHRHPLRRDRVPQRRLDGVVAEGVRRQVAELALEEGADGGRDVHPGGGRLVQQLLHHPHAVLLRAERGDVLGDLRDEEGRVRVPEGDADAPRAVRVERALHHVPVELRHQRLRVGRRRGGKEGLHDARALRVAEEARHVAAEGGREGGAEERERRELGDEVVAERVLGEGAEVRRQLAGCGGELLVPQRREQALQRPRPLCVQRGGDEGAPGDAAAWRLRLRRHLLRYRRPPHRLARRAEGVHRVLVVHRRRHGLRRHLLHVLHRILVARWRRHLHRRHLQPHLHRHPH